MKIIFQFAMMLLMLVSIRISAQEAATTKVKELEKLRKESGVDPTQVSTRFNIGQEFLDPKGSGYSYNNTFKLTVGIGNWAFYIKTRARSTYTPGEQNGTFSSGIDDFTFSAANTVYYKGKNAINVAVELLAPVGSPAFSSQSFLMTPNFTYAYTISPKLIFALNPQYSFTVAKSDVVPAVSLATIRPFFAGFFPSGVFAVIEPRVLYNFKAEQLDIIISPILGKSLGKGWNIVGIVEAPVTNERIETLGMMYKFGVQKNF
jgi:hypothetical protein